MVLGGNVPRETDQDIKKKVAQQNFLFHPRILQCKANSVCCWTTPVILSLGNPDYKGWFRQLIRRAEMVSHGQSIRRENTSTRGSKRTSSSSGYMGRLQTVCPRLGRLALVDPGASMLKFAAAQAVKKRSWQCGDFTTTRSNSRGSQPWARKRERSKR